MRACCLSIASCNLLYKFTYNRGVYEVPDHVYLFFYIYVVEVNARGVNQLGDGGEVGGVADGGDGHGDLPSL